MSKLSADAIAQHAYDAGFRGQDLTTAVAVALAESGGDTHAHNGTPPDNSYGLWQINMLGNLEKARQKEFGIDSNSELYKADTNAEAARDVFKDAGGSFQPWSTYTNGAYKKHLAEARKAAQHAGSGKGHDKGHGGHKGHGSHGKGHGGHGSKHPAGGGSGSGGGYAVDTDQLDGYAKQARGYGDALGQIGKRDLHAVRELAEHSFGKIGKQSGFAEALGDFSEALQRNVRANGSAADRLGGDAAKVSKVYRGYENQTARDIKDVLG